MKPIFPTSMATDLAKIRDRTIIEVLFKLGFPLPEMIKLIPGMYGKNGPSRNTIVKIVQTLETRSFSYLDSVPVGKMMNPELIKTIFQHVSLYPYDSLRQIARTIGSNKDTVSRILRTKLLMRRKKLKWVPHSLTDEQKLSRVQTAKAMLEIISKDAKHDFKHIITGDETWLFFRTFHEDKWIRAGSEVETRVRPTIGTKKQMLVVFWGIEETPVLNLLPRDESMNTATFVELAINSLKKFYRKSLEPEEVIYVHMDNAPCHRAALSRDVLKNTKLVELPQPPYSPDLAPCDFFLFGYLKSRMRGFHFQDSDSMLVKANEIIASIPNSMRLTVFRDWIERLETVVRIGGEYL
jgi:histone-lysine N-methyltransferase SETMAR